MRLRGLAVLLAVGLLSTLAGSAATRAQEPLATAAAPPAIRADQIRRHVVAKLHLADPRIAPAVMRQATCLAYAVYFEARGESRLGQLAVASVVVNRLRLPAYPKTICAVILDEGQFPWVTGDLTVTNRRDFAIARSVALHVMAGVFIDPTSGATHFYAPALVAAPAWATPDSYQATIGNHLFFKLP